MEEVNCIICNSISKSIFEKLYDRLGKTSNLFSINECECGFVYLDPRPTEKNIHIYYKSDNYDPHSTEQSYKKYLYNLVQRISFVWKMKIIYRYKKNGRLLDIGGGNGNFALYMSKKKWKVFVQDKFVYTNSKINIFKSLNQIERNNYFDIITLWHSLEHIHDIRGLFYSINKMLNKNGYLIIAVPNLNAPEKYFYNKLWAPYDAPRHLYHFNFNSLKRLCSKYNFEILNSYSMYQDLPYNILLSIDKVTFYKIFKGIIIFLFSFFYTFILGPKYSSSILIVCKKV